MRRPSTTKRRPAILAIAGGAMASGAFAAALWASSNSQALTPVPSITHYYAGNHLHGLAYVPEAEGLYLATHFGLFLLRDGQLFQVGEVRDDLMGFTHAPDDPETFYASGHPRGGGNLGVIVSQDGGLTWQQIFTGMSDEVVDFHSMVASPADPEQLYGVFAGELYVGDAGSGDWHVALAEGISLEGFCWGVPCLAAAADDPDRLFAGTPQGVFVSRDAGDRWQRLDGISGAVAGVGAHPNEPDLLVAHSEQLGIAISADGGESWESREGAIALDGRDFIFGFAFDPENAERFFAASVHGRVFETDDAGASWRMVLGPDGPPS
jgi:hypothetical protein